MGKKSKRSKKHRRRHTYSKKEFMDIVCAQSCKLCPKGTDPKFCYEELHRKKKRLFFSNILPKLVKAKQEWVDYCGVNSIAECDDAVIEDVFTDCFCEANACGDYLADEHCIYLPGCIQAFRKSMNMANTASEPGGTKKRKKNKRKRFIPERYATFFCNQGFDEEFRQIINGDNSKEQDTSPKLPRSFERADF